MIWTLLHGDYLCLEDDVHPTLMIRFAQRGHTQHATLYQLSHSSGWSEIKSIMVTQTPNPLSQEKVSEAKSILDEYATFLYR